MSGLQQGCTSKRGQDNLGRISCITLRFSTVVRAGPQLHHLYQKTTAKEFNVKCYAKSLIGCWNVRNPIIFHPSLSQETDGILVLLLGHQEMLAEPQNLCPVTTDFYWDSCCQVVQGLVTKGRFGLMHTSEQESSEVSQSLVAANSTSNGHIRVIAESKQ